MTELVSLLLVVAAFAAIILAVFLLSAIKEKMIVILFIDAPDPDNPAAAMAVWRYILEKKGHLHLVLTGRPVNLRTAKNFKEGVPNKEKIVRQKWEKAIPEHSARVLEDSAVRIANYLEKCGVPSHSFTIYDGGVARESPVSDVAHDWDFLFDRKDLVTHREENKGEILHPEEYGELVVKYSSLSASEREQSFLSLLRRYDLTPLEQLREQLEGAWTRKKITVFLGGPATALVKLFKGRKSVCQNISSFYAMFGSLRPGEKTLFANQFNAACDLEAARQVFVDNLFPSVTARLVTTETAKLPLFVLSAQEMEERGVREHVVKLQKLWEWTHGNRPQPMFDVLPVMAAMATHKDCFTWRRKKASMKIRYDGDEFVEIFVLEDTISDLSLENTSTVLVSQDCSTYDKDSFIQFFAQIWK